MIRLLTLAILAVSLPAFGAANLATKTKTKNNTTTVTPAKKSSGKSSLTISEARATKRGYTLVPMLGLASFTMHNYKVGDAQIRSDEGLAVGLMADYALKNTNFIFQGGISYYQLGARLKATNNVGQAISGTAKLDYLGFTTAAKHYFPNRMFYGKGGLVTLINTRSDYEIKVPGRNEKGKIQNIRDMDFMAQIGGGFEFPVNNEMKMGAELTYNRGLLDVTTAGDREVSNEGFLFSGIISL